MGVRLAIVHCHLLPGGVTRVIENAVEALAGKESAVRFDTLVLTGEPYTGNHLPATTVVPDLAYRDTSIVQLRCLRTRKWHNCIQNNGSATTTHP
jgi:hypothetical protein